MLILFNYRGGFMLIHDHKVETSEVFDFRETAPATINPSIFQKDPSKMKLVGFLL
jgi:gamma-glutamyltranspeptidase